MLRNNSALLRLGHDAARGTDPLAAGARAIVAHRDSSLRERVAGLLRRDGFEAVAAHDGRALVDQLARWIDHDGRSADVVVVGTRLQGADGAELARQLSATGDRSPAVILALDEEEALDHDTAAQAVTPFVFRPPFEDDDLRTVAVFLHRRRHRASRATAA